MIRKFASAPVSVFLLAAGMIGGALHAQPQGPFTLVETGQQFASLQDAVNAIGGGQGTIRIAPGTYEDCAVQEAGRVTFMAATRGTAIFDGGICEDKATLVLRGRSARVEGLVFAHMHVGDGNGAAIRIEHGNRDVVQAMLVDGQCGILSATDPNGAVSIDQSTFSRLGKEPDGSGAHSVYIGHYGALRITNTRFERG